MKPYHGKAGRVYPTSASIPYFGSFKIHDNNDVQSPQPEVFTMQSFVYMRNDVVMVVIAR